MRSKWDNFSKEEIIEILNTSKSFKEVSQRIGYSGCNLTISNKIREKAKELGVKQDYLNRKTRKPAEMIGKTYNYLQI